MHQVDTLPLQVVELIARDVARPIDLPAFSAPLGRYLTQAIGHEGGRGQLLERGDGYHGPLDHLELLIIVFQERPQLLDFARLLGKLLETVDQRTGDLNELGAPVERVDGLIGKDTEIETADRQALEGPLKLGNARSQPIELALGVLAVDAFQRLDLAAQVLRALLLLAQSKAKGVELLNGLAQVRDELRRLRLALRAKRRDHRHHQDRRKPEQGAPQRAACASRPCLRRHPRATATSGSRGICTAGIPASMARRPCATSA